MTEGRSGFTLIEVVVALTILSAGLVYVHRINGAAALGQRGAQDRSAALLLAEERMTLATRAPRQGVEEGRELGLAWRVVVDPVGDVVPNRLWRVEVTVTGARIAPVRLLTLKNGGAE
ncbi:MAG: prepilin-type N-terminal cleavage/methylation domain-containing protein [Pseudomonadota bacterium]